MQKNAFDLAVGAELGQNYEDERGHPTKYASHSIIA